MATDPQSLGSTDFFEYDPDSNKWLNLQDIVLGMQPTGRSAHGFTGCNGKIYLFGGLTDSGGGAVW